MATRDDAQAILEQLAGPTARLRDDQWTAIEALVVHRRRALVVQRTGWGKSAVYFIAAKLLREAGQGATVIVSPLLALMRNQVAAAERAGVHAATINSSNVAEWDEIHERVRRRRARRPAGQPGTVEQPRLSRPGAARAGTGRRPCGGRRGALRVGLGPRLPARLPAHPHPDRRTGHRRSGAGHHGDRQRPRGRRCRHPVGRRWRETGARHLGAARRTRPRVAAAVGGQGGQSGAARGLACSASRFAARLRASSTP